MTEIHEMPDGFRCSHGVVHEHHQVVRASGPPVDQHEGEIITSQLSDGRVRHEARGDDDAVDLSLAEHSQVLVLALRRVLGVAEHEVVAARARRLLDPFDDRREERVVDVRHEHPESERPL